MNQCRDCKFWGFEDELTDNKDRSCILFSDNARYIPGTYTNEPHPIPDDQRFAMIKARAFPFAGADGAVFNTDAEFGCIQWTAR